jgi:hypothetical protein
MILQQQRREHLPNIHIVLHEEDGKRLVWFGFHEW